jgi:hypothetical protein
MCQLCVSGGKRDEPTERSKLLECSRREIDIIVATSVAAVDDANCDGLSAPGEVGSLSASLVVVGIAVCNDSVRTSSTQYAVRHLLTNHHFLEQARSDGSNQLRILVLPAAGTEANRWVV